MMARRAKRVHEGQAQERKKACVLKCTVYIKSEISVYVKSEIPEARCLRNNKDKGNRATKEYNGNGLRAHLAI